MDISPQNSATQPISDDQELAKALAGVSLDDPEETPAGTTNTPSVASVPPASDASDPNPRSISSMVNPGEPSAPALPPNEPLAQSNEPSTQLPEPTASPAVEPPLGASNTTGSLDNIKLDAIKELRPLMDHVELPPEEKFDTYLMLIRSTDDSTLIQPAYQAAQNISDEKRKAEALLEIIKEIDFLSPKDK